MYKPFDLFSKTNLCIQKFRFDDWYILSTKYGLLKKDTIISPYDVTLNNMKVAERKNWSENVFDEIQRELPYESHIYIFASEKYRQYLLPNLEEAGFTCNVPLKGTGFGEQIQYLKNRY